MEKQFLIDYYEDLIAKVKSINESLPDGNELISLDEIKVLKTKKEPVVKAPKPEKKEKKGGKRGRKAKNSKDDIESQDLLKE